jgi:hypothetical protein
VRGRIGILPLALLLLVVLAGCMGQRSLTQEEVDGRAQEYFQRGMDQFQRGEFKPALESFRLAKAYDIQGKNTTIPEMIEKTEARLRVNVGPAAAAAPALGAIPVATAKPGGEMVYKTYHSRLYPYALELPESWTVDPNGAKVGNSPADLLVAPKGDVRASLIVVAHLLPDDIDRRGYVEANIKLLRAQGLRADEIGKRTVDGAEATLLKAQLNNELGRSTATFALFASEGIGWGLNFTAAADQSDKLQPLFHRILDSFRVDQHPTI